MIGYKHINLVIGRNILMDTCIVFSDRIYSYGNEKDLDLCDQVIHGHHNYLSAGFIDIHIHGMNGHDVMDGKTAIEAIAATLPNHGVTSFLPTTITASYDDIQRVLQDIKTVMNEKTPLSAHVIGTHLEGPFINPIVKGAHSEVYITPPTYDYISNYSPDIALITLAPEMDTDFSFSRQVLSETDIQLSVGHSYGDYQTIKEAYKIGYRSITHFFNAMKPFNHREPGVIGAGLNEAFYVELIADNIHVHPENYKWLIQSKGVDKVILVTDAMRACCLKPGHYKLGELDVVVDKDSARLNDGTLAGSILKLNEGMRHVFEQGSVTLADVVLMVTENPADLLGLKDRGRIKENNLADLTLFDASFNISKVYIEGKEFRG